jgi:hypothetical protein
VAGKIGKPAMLWKTEKLLLPSLDHFSAQENKGITENFA